MSSQTRGERTAAQVRRPLIRVSLRGPALRPGAFTATALGIAAGTGLLAGALSPQSGGGFFDSYRLVFVIAAVAASTIIVFATTRLPALASLPEYARLRACGASRGQVFGVAVSRALLTGLIGAALGWALGGPVGSLATRGIPAFPTTYEGYLEMLSPITLAYCLALGGLASIAAPLPPVIEAFRAPPVQALREAEAPAPRSVVPRTVIGIAVTTVGLGLIHLGVVRIVDLNGITLGGGAVVTLVGALTLLPTASVVAAAIVGPVLRPVAPAAARLAQRNLRRDPRRSLATAQAFFVVMTAASAAAVLAASTPQPGTVSMAILPLAGAAVLIVPALATLLRVRECGLLRASGMQRRSILAMALTESFLTLLYALALGLAVGTGLAAALCTYLGDPAVLVLTIPYDLLGWLLLGAGVLGLAGTGVGSMIACRPRTLKAIAGG